MEDAIATELFSYAGNGNNSVFNCVLVLGYEVLRCWTSFESPLSLLYTLNDDHGALRRATAEQHFKHGLSEAAKSTRAPRFKMNEGGVKTRGRVKTRC